ncbi:acyltransferase family protein [Hyphomonas chukchiensis]|uniref:acyltransferase family protein n=1 Tax=Hyphomonas chukchiensis TaxID=1280947 RepID=UPI0009DCF828|nr:acyltransferase [Hyphomonas chukchiensis]
MSESAHRFIVLDGLRGAAALLVISDHIPSVIWNIAPSRALAVDFFFVLSGFVLAHAYGDRLSSSMSVRAFMTRRLIRLYPLYILGSTLGAMLIAAQVLKGWMHVPLSEFAIVSFFGIAFLPCPPFFDWTASAPFPFDGPAWSLFFELVANLLLASFAFLRRRQSLLIFLPIAALALAYFTVQSGTFDMGWKYETFPGGAARLVYEFFAGVLIYDFWRKGYRWHLPAAIAFALLFVVAMGSALTHNMFRMAWDLSMQLVFIPLIVALAANATVSGSLARLCTVLGNLSYGIYMLHIPILIAMGLVTNHLFGEDQVSGLTMTLIVAVLATIAAALVHTTYDVPLRNMLTQRLKARSTSAE